MRDGDMDLAYNLRAGTGEWTLGRGAGHTPEQPLPLWGHPPTYHFPVEADPMGNHWQGGVGGDAGWGSWGIEGVGTILILAYKGWGWGSSMPHPSLLSL